MIKGARLEAVRRDDERIPARPAISHRLSVVFKELALSACGDRPKFISARERAAFT